MAKEYRVQLRATQNEKGLVEWDVMIKRPNMPVFVSEFHTGSQGSAQRFADQVVSTLLFHDKEAEVWV